MASDLDFDLAVIVAAQAIVAKPTPSYSYVDVGDVLVAHLRGEKTGEQALQSLRDLHETYERHRRPRPLLPMMVVVGERAVLSVVRQELGLPGSWAGWTRHVRCAQTDDDFHTLRGLRGPNVWWVDWGATNEQKVFCHAHDFTQKTLEECRDTLSTYLTF